MNTDKKLRGPQPGRSDIELIKLKRLWTQMPQSRRLIWFGVFSLDVPLRLLRRLVWYEFGLRLRSDEQLFRFVLWVLEFDDARQIQNN